MDGESGQPRERRTSIDGAHPARSFARPENIDVIPAYHALATDVIDNQPAGNSLQHVHANILAEWYHGQLVRVMEFTGTLQQRVVVSKSFSDRKNTTLRSHVFSTDCS